MCKYCESHDDYYEGSLIDEKVDLGFGGEMRIWSLIDPGKRKLGLIMLNRKTSEQLEFFKSINFCPVCGERLNSGNR